MKSARPFYRLAASLSFAVAAVHLVIIFIGAPAYRFFDAGEQMARAAEAGSTLPALLTLGITIVLAVFGVYALAGAQDIPRLPFQRFALWAITGIYLLRGAAIFVELTVRLLGNPYAL